MDRHARGVAGASEARAESAATAMLTAPSEVKRIRGILALGGLPGDDLDDGLQMVRLRLLERRTDARDQEVRNPLAWAAVVATRIAIDWHRNEARQSGLRSRLAAHQVADGGAGWSDDQTPMVAAVAGALDVLSTEQRQVVVLRYYADLRIREIATTMNVPSGTVKSRLHNAMRLMRKHLRESEEL